MPIGIILLIVALAVLFYALICSVPHECPRCGRWNRYYDHCEWCGWRLR